ncbi:hypothetical protein AAHK14_02185 [Moraxella sp. K1664]|uniref:hypothetical protein n=1 Tax=Moraxella sp. K1664 TaxID=2780077 RepID=UPI001D1221EA|nr:hypothetical protein [Moraxella sp. K1664]
MTDTPILGGTLGDIIHRIHHFDGLGIRHAPLSVFFAKGGKMLIVYGLIAKQIILATAQIYHIKSRYALATP